MKIIHLISSRGVFGAESVVINLAKEQKRQGLDVLVAAFKSVREPHIEIIEKAKSQYLQVITFDCDGKFDVNTIQTIRKFIKDNGIELIHSHGYKSNLYSLMAGLNLGIKRVTTCHNWLAENTKMKFYEYLDKLCLRLFDRVVAVSREIETEIVRAGVNPEKVALIGNGIDFTDFSTVTDKPENNLDIKDNEKIVGTVGRLAKEKGHAYLVEATGEIIKTMPEVKVLIIGDGPLKNSLESLVTSLKLENKIIFAGIRNDIPEMLKLMDVFVLPSLMEGMPMALLEAMAAKVPVVATEVGAVPTIIQNNKSGLLVAPKNTKALAEAIIWQLTNQENAELMANKGCEIVRQSFSTQSMGEKYLKLYESI